MDARQVQHAPQIGQRCAIELQGSYRGTTAWRDSKKLREVIVPRKMLGPFLATRVKQRYDLVSFGIYCLGFLCFVSITS